MENGPTIFDKEATISRSASEIEKILIMQQREYVHNKVEIWLNTMKGTSDYQRAKRRAKSAIRILLSKLDFPMLKRDKERRNKVWEQFKKENYYEVLELINTYLIGLGLTNIYRKKIDTENVEEENLEKGL